MSHTDTVDTGTAASERDLDALADRRERLRREHLREAHEPTLGRGIHHTALLCADPERTIRFYTEILGFPLTEVLENRDYAGSTHFFFDAGNGNQIAFFDMPGLDLGEYREVLGGLHHLAISVSRDDWERVQGRLACADIPHQEESGTSLYLNDPDGVRLELIAEPLGEMYGTTLL